MDEWSHEAAGSTPPPYILDGSALQALHPDGPEQHGVEGWAQDTNGWQHCLNPKCGHAWTQPELQQLEAGGVSCPVCHTYVSRDRLERMGQQGGGTKSGLSLKQVGDIGEAVVRGMGEIPGIGPVQPTDGSYNHPIDAIVVSQADGVRYGCEIKSQSSTSKGYYWSGAPGDKKRTLLYCMQNGLKPALIAVRLNFFNDKANILFREGLSSGWIGNPKMRHVATVDFSHLNPFQTPEEKDALLQAGPVDESGRVDTNHPDYDFEKDLDSMFGPAGIPGAIARAVHSWDEDEHPRSPEGKFVAKKAIHEIDVRNRSGKYEHTLARCRHCGHVYGFDKEEKGRIECPTCGEDPQRKLRLTKVIAGRDPVRNYMLANSWTYSGRNGQGHHYYSWTGPDGTVHRIMTGQTNNPPHVNMDLEMSSARKRMAKCFAGECAHKPIPEEIQEGTLAGAPLIHAGQAVTFGNGKYWVMEIDGSLALIYDQQTGAEDVVPVTELQAVAGQRQSDYNGWSNWDTWHAGLMMDDDQQTHNQALQFAQQGNKQAWIDWMLQAVIGPYNKQRIQDAKEWNTIPPEERIDQNYEDMREQHPQAADLYDSIGEIFGQGGPDVSDDQPQLMDPGLINWDEIWGHMVNEIEEERRHQEGLPPTWKDPKPNPDEPGDMTLPDTWSRTADRDPEYMFVAYNGKLIVEPWHHNLREIDLVERLLHELGYSLAVEDDVDPADVVIGVVRGEKVRIDSATRPEANDMALEALRRWQKDDDENWQTLREEPEEWQPI